MDEQIYHASIHNANKLIFWIVVDLKAIALSRHLKHKQEERRFGLRRIITWFWYMTSVIAQENTLISQPQSQTQHLANLLYQADLQLTPSHPAPFSA